MVEYLIIIVNIKLEKNYVFYVDIWVVWGCYFNMLKIQKQYNLLISHAYIILGNILAHNIKL